MEDSKAEDGEGLAQPVVTGAWDDNGLTLPWEVAVQMEQRMEAGAPADSVA